jgi:hypothetical protein
MTDQERVKWLREQIESYERMREDCGGVEARELLQIPPRIYQEVIDTLFSEVDDA